ncbi:MAG: hypothetical protein WHS87_01045 [Anaerolineales bacterium]
MRVKKLLFPVLIAVLLLASCGPQATPTVNPVEIQATAVSMALTMAAQTLAAMPTNTPLPTNTPVPTPTETPTPAIPTAVLPTNTPQTSGGDPCSKILSNPPGPKTTVIVRNQTKGSVNPWSLYLYRSNVGECGFISVSPLGIGDSLTLNIPLGCYYAYAYITTKKEKTSAAGDFCITTEGQWEIFINTGVISAKLD